MARKLERGGYRSNKKKKERKKVEEYREVTLMPTLYKMYAMALAERLKKERDRERIISRTQTGFRKGMGDNRQYRCYKLRGE